MKIIVAPDSFKGSMTSFTAGEQISKAAKEIFEKAQIVSLPMADGGEGSLDAALFALGGKTVAVTVKGPLGDPVSARYILSSHTAFIEMAQASGLTLIPHNDSNALDASSYGTGQLIMDALERGATNIFIAVGGSASTDGGTGALTAMGVHFIDRDGYAVNPCGRELSRIEHIDTKDLQLPKADFTVLCDVDNPLCGPDGAVMTYSAQKGVSENDMFDLEQGMKHYQDIIMSDMKTDLDMLPRMGAAGGLSAALFTFLDARMESGAEAFLRMVRFDEALCGADIVVTGEGRIDGSSLHGKVISAVCEHARAAGVPAYAVTGSIALSEDKLNDMGLSGAEALVNSDKEIEKAVRNAERYTYDAAVRLFDRLAE